ncbi:hypothetical protein B5D80_32575 [Micromonospora wenchangensis]|uniref:Uncharacterized protein n=1 Tax=Micromonospora wenchangensis TaxID=1185415 RepID=A0A246R6M3_9ACTN|nr:hypothetical protein B5D80_32575 [Micromonospora wenchangensis]
MLVNFLKKSRAEDLANELSECGFALSRATDQNETSSRASIAIAGVQMNTVGTLDEPCACSPYYGGSKHVLASIRPLRLLQVLNWLTSHREIYEYLRKGDRFISRMPCLLKLSELVGEKLLL